MGPKKSKISYKKQIKLRETLHEMREDGIIERAAYTRLMDIINPAESNDDVTIHPDTASGSTQSIAPRWDGIEVVSTPHGASENRPQLHSAIVVADMMDDDFEILSDIDGTGTRHSARSVSTKDDGLSLPMECNIMFRKERSKAKRKSKHPKNKTDTGKRRNENLCKDSQEHNNSLDGEPTGHSVGEHGAEIMMADLNHKTMDIVKGCLFLRCKECPSMVRIRFSSGVLPKMSVDLDAEYTNGIVMTFCKSCDDIKEDLTRSRAGWDDHFTANCARGFREMRLDPGLMEGSKFVRAASLVANGNVSLMTTKGHVHFEDRTAIWDHIQLGDEIASMHVDEVGSGEVNAILQSHLVGGFF
ncbi:hypothetical protein LTR09_012087 [Extremus antarcticus]|uniref:Uncharacterized protein n=1 Tax=Extremus antarcticus TaxID=702011 RepID=A0AAJ0G9P7_9PEZI|nr:hypothetical protein LTR09_012087 [Extremus antarcticus]